MRREDICVNLKYVTRVPDVVWYQLCFIKLNTRPYNNIISIPATLCNQISCSWEQLVSIPLCNKRNTNALRMMQYLRLPGFRNITTPNQELIEYFMVKGYLTTCFSE